jgi:hypothetical protein
LLALAGWSQLLYLPEGKRLRIRQRGREVVLWIRIIFVTWIRIWIRIKWKSRSPKCIECESILSWCGSGSASNKKNQNQDPHQGDKSKPDRVKVMRIQMPLLSIFSLSGTDTWEKCFGSGSFWNRIRIPIWIWIQILPSISKYMKRNLDFNCFCDFSMTCYLRRLLHHPKQMTSRDDIKGLVSLSSFVPCPKTYGSYGPQN